jgi:hypothetical protein
MRCNDFSTRGFSWLLVTYRGDTAGCYGRIEVYWIEGSEYGEIPSISSFRSVPDLQSCKGHSVVGYCTKNPSLLRKENGTYLVQGVAAKGRRGLTRAQHGGRRGTEPISTYFKLPVVTKRLRRHKYYKNKGDYNNCLH